MNRLKNNVAKSNFCGWRKQAKEIFSVNTERQHSLTCVHIRSEQLVLLEVSLLVYGRECITYIIHHTLFPNDIQHVKDLEVLDRLLQAGVEKIAA